MRNDGPFPNPLRDFLTVGAFTSSDVLILCGARTLLIVFLEFMFYQLSVANPLFMGWI